MTRVTTSLVPAVRARGSSTGMRRVGAVLTSLWLPVLLVAIWWFVTANSSSPFFPPLGDILVETWNQWVVLGAWTNAVVIAIVSVYFDYMSTIVSLILLNSCNCSYSVYLIDLWIDGRQYIDVVSRYLVYLRVHPDVP
jgi:hypothetical protein